MGIPAKPYGDLRWFKNGLRTDRRCPALSYRGYIVLTSIGQGSEHEGKGKHEVIASTWDAASLLSDSPCCINPLEARDYGKPGRGYYGRAKVSDPAWHSSSHCNSLCFHRFPPDG